MSSEHQTVTALIEGQLLKILIYWDGNSLCLPSPGSIDAPNYEWFFTHRFIGIGSKLVPIL